MNFLPWSRFLITVSSPACIGNRNHFRTHRDQILIGSLVNSKQVNGRALQKDTFTARLLLYVYVSYLLLPPPKNSLDLHQSQEWSLAKVGWTCPPQSTPWQRPCLARLARCVTFMASYASCARTVRSHGARMVRIIIA